MAKKQTLSIVEAHLEKIALGAAVAVCLAVILLRFIMGSGVINGKPASEALADAAQQTDRLADQMNQTGDKAPPPAPPPANVIEVDPLPLRIVDRVPWDSPGVEGQEVGPNLGPMRIPPIPALQEVIVNLTHAQADVPVNIGNPSVTTEDVDFVTMEAVFPIAQLRDSFRGSFGDLQTLPNPVDPDPVVGVVDLQHSRLLLDGSWGDWESGVGLRNINLRTQEIMSSNMTKLRDAQYQVMLQDRMIKEVQAQVLRPPAYQLTTGIWQPPKESRQQSAEAAGASRGGSSRRGSRGGRTQTTAPTTQPATTLGATTQQGLPGVLPDEPEDWLTQDEVRIWAHDSMVRPNEYYRFRMRIGIFNPIAGKDWFVEDQQDLKNEILLWSAWATPGKFGQSGDSVEEDFVHIPLRVAFFPQRTGTNTSQKTAKVEVRKWQNGKVNKRIFTVGPGSAIGEMVTEPAGSPDEDPITIDYRTGATLLDIIPDRVHYSGSGSRINKVVTMDLVYREANGTIKWLGADPATWPQSLIDLRNEFN